MEIFLTGPIKDLEEDEVINVPFSEDIDQVRKEIIRALPGIQRIPFRISVNGQIGGSLFHLKKDDCLELITLLQGG